MYVCGECLGRQNEKDPTINRTGYANRYKQHREEDQELERKRKIKS